MTKLQAIAYKTKKSGPMIEVEQASVGLSTGIENDIFGKPGKRQVTVMSSEQWNIACNELEPKPAIPLHWTTRRCNLLVSQITFSAADVDKYLVIGKLILQITGETDPCKKMRNAHPKLEQALTPNWRGGVTCRVIQEASIAIGDPIAFSNENPLIPRQQHV